MVGSSGEMGEGRRVLQLMCREMEMMAKKELLPPGVKESGWKILVFHYKPFCNIWILNDVHMFLNLRMF